jgi:hypothetical protein
MLLSQPVSAKYEMDWIGSKLGQRIDIQIILANFKRRMRSISDSQNSAIFRIVSIHNPIRQKPGRRSYQDSFPPNALNGPICPSVHCCCLPVIAFGLLC